MNEQAVRLKVVEIASGFAGPALGRLYAGMGHEVLKFELGIPDYVRRIPPLGGGGMSVEFVNLNSAKSVHRVDPTDPKSVAGVIDALAAADVAVFDLATVSAFRWLAPERIRQAWPALVAVFFSNLGVDTPTDLPAASGALTDSLIGEAYGGLATMIGDPTRRPLSLGGEQIAFASAYTGFLAANLALYRRDQGASGEIVDIALCDVAAYSDWKGDVSAATNGEPPGRTGQATDIWRMVKAADGWVGIMFREEQWPILAELVGEGLSEDGRLNSPRGRDEFADVLWGRIEKWASQRLKVDIYDEARVKGLPFGYCATMADIATSEQLTERGFLVTGDDAWRGRVPSLTSPHHWPSWVSSEPAEGEARLVDSGGVRVEAASVAARTEVTAPLAGMLVLDFGTITAGAAAGRLLADHGATVIKVEGAAHPDPFRKWASTEASPHFASNNVGKLGLCVDLKSEDGRTLIEPLIAECDVIIENFRVGVTRRLGIDFDRVHETNPNVVYLSLSSQGQHGPESGNISYGSTIDLLSGLASITGYDERYPVWSSRDVNYADQIVSTAGAGMVVYCLLLGLRGVHLDVSQREVALWPMAGFLSRFMVTGEVPVPTGNRRPYATPRDTFQCCGGDWIAISCRSDQDRHNLSGLIAATELAGHDEAWWHEHSDLVSERISQWTRRRSRTEAVAAANSAGVPCVPVLTADERRALPQFRERRVVLERKSGNGLNVPLKGFPMRLQNWTPPQPNEAPTLGQDSWKVLEQYCGLDEAQIRDLVGKGIVT